MKILILTVTAFTWCSFSTAQNVGIGRTSPQLRLDVLDTLSLNVARFTGGNSMFITLSEKLVNRGYIGSYAGNPEDVDFGTFSGNNTGKVHLTTFNLPRLTVAADGNIGIGTVLPQQQLSVAKGLVIDQDNDNTDFDSLINVISFGSSSGEAIGSFRTNNRQFRSLDFYTDSTKRLTISGGGTIRIDPMDLNTGAFNGPQLYFGSGAEGIQSIRVNAPGIGNGLSFTAGGSIRMQLTTSGLLGIGTTNPSNRLEVNGSFQTKSLQLDGGSIFEKMQHGTYSVGPSASSTITATITFPEEFTALPKVFATARNQPATNFGDTFSVSIRSLTNTTVVFNIQRTDTNGFWSQQLQLDWFAVQ
ncbi:MAG: hypothetical protein V4722_03625 [Bacteroidota bacterium]